MSSSSSSSSLSSYPITRGIKRQKAEASAKTKVFESTDLTVKILSYLNPVELIASGKVAKAFQARRLLVFQKQTIIVGQSAFEYRLYFIYKQFVNQTPNIRDELQFYPLLISRDNIDLRNHLTKYCSSISVLEIAGSYINNDQLEVLQHITPNLTTLNLSRCANLSGVGLRNISNFKSLTSLSLLDMTNFNADELLTVVGKMTQLTDLALSCNARDFSPLSTLTNLTSLKLYDASRLNDATLLKAVSQMLKLETLIIENETPMPGITVKGLIQALEPLTKTLTFFGYDVSGYIMKNLSNEEIDKLSLALNMRVQTRLPLVLTS